MNDVNVNLLTIRRDVKYCLTKGKITPAKACLVRTAVNTILDYMGLDDQGYSKTIPGYMRPKREKSK